MKKNSVAFLGASASALVRSTDLPDVVSSIAARLDKTIAQLYKQGYTTFLTGMSQGFELIAAEVVLATKAECPGIRLIAVVPFPKQVSSYSVHNKVRYNAVLEAADEVVQTSEIYSNASVVRWHDYLQENASVIVCYTEGETDGTMYMYHQDAPHELTFIKPLPIEK